MAAAHSSRYKKLPPKLLKHPKHHRQMRISLALTILIIVLLGCAAPYAPQAVKQAPQPERSAQERAGPPEQITIVALGDSLTAGTGIDPQDAWPARLEHLLQENGTNATVINMGVAGESTAVAAARIDAVLAADPDIVIIALGANDAAQLIDPDITRGNLEQIIQKLQEQEITVVLAGSPVISIPQWDFPQRFTSLYPELAQEYDLIYIPFFLEGVVGNAEANLPDGVHPNEKGHLLIAQTVHSSLAPVMHAT
jgi:acyl-CoA thioesterase I